MSKKKRNLGWLLAVVLSLPALWLLHDAFTVTWTKRLYHSLIINSGETAARLLIVSLLATPLLRIGPRWAISKWLRRHRRTFGLAAFSYGVLHFSFYLYWKFDDVLGHLTNLSILLGYTALILMIPLALTSRDRAIQRLGKKWITLHRAVYFVALAAALHWWRMGGLVAASLHFVPLLVLQANRIRLYRAKATGSRQR